MDVREIIREYLIENHYDGLYLENHNIEDSCGCEINNLCPCDGMDIELCRAGIKHECNCGFHDFHITEEI